MNTKSCTILHPPSNPFPSSIVTITTANNCFTPEVMPAIISYKKRIVTQTVTVKSSTVISSARKSCLPFAKIESITDQS